MSNIFDFMQFVNSIDDSQFDGMSFLVDGEPQLFNAPAVSPQ